MNKFLQLTVPVLSFSSGAFVLASNASDHFAEAQEAERDQRNIFNTPLCFDIQDKSCLAEDQAITPDMHKPIEFGAFIGAMAH